MLESIQFELNACSKEVVQGKTAILSDQTVAKIRQDVSELKNEFLENLRELFDERFQIFWMDKEVVESHQILRLHGGVEDLLSFKEFVPEEVTVLFVSATIAISFLVLFSALFFF